MKTHRCKELLEHNNKDFRKVFIRYGKEYDFDVPNNKIGWWLNHVDYDYEWGHEYTSTICMIKYHNQLLLNSSLFLLQVYVTLQIA